MSSVINLKGRKPQVVHEDRGEVYIGRQLNMGGWRLLKSKWANPYKITAEMPREKVLAEYRKYVQNNPVLMSSLHELKGKTLCCWCYPPNLQNPPIVPWCHGDILVDLVKTHVV